MCEPALPQSEAGPPAIREIPPGVPINGPAGKGWLECRGRILDRPEKSRTRKGGLFVVHPCPFLFGRFQNFRIREARARTRGRPLTPG